MQRIPFYLSLDDVLLLPGRSAIDSRKQVDLSWDLDGHHLTLPLIAINMDSVTGVDMAVAMGKLGGLAILPRFDIPEIQAQKVRQVKKSSVPAAAALGIKDEEDYRLKLLIAAGVDHISIDVAHGHLEKNLKFIQKIRTAYPALSLSAGVVGTYQAAVDLFSAGVDIVRVGVGPGTICTTRTQTGCGAPQFTAIRECARAARKLAKIIWADGGTKNSGDVVKCLAAGASAVITGSQLAGVDESPSEMLVVNGKKFKRYNASTSLTEKIKQFNTEPAAKDEFYTQHIEGVESLVPYRGPLKSVIDQITAGIRSGYSYCGAGTTPDLWQKAQFCRVTSLGVRENGAHDVVLTESAAPLPPGP